MAGERPIAAGRLELPPSGEFAGLWGGGTVPDWRHRGVFRSLVAYRAAIARDRGFRYLQVDAAEASRPILERLGFVELAKTMPYRPLGGQEVDDAAEDEGDTDQDPKGTKDERDDRRA